jgi:hypothetical protein
MSPEFQLLVASQGAQWVLLMWHLLRCRDVRLDIERVKLHVGIRDTSKD